MTDVTRAVLYDDRALIRHGLRGILTAAGMAVVGEAGSLTQATAVIAAAEPDVVVTGCRDGDFRIVRRLRSASRRARIILLSARRDRERAHRAVRAGASGYLLKDATETEIVQAVCTVATGGTYIDSRLAAPVVRAASGRVRVRGKGGELSPREEQVLRLLALGHTNPEIARELTISVRTVESHRLHVQQKLGRPSRAEMYRIAESCGLLEDTNLYVPPEVPFREIERIEAEGVSA